MKDKGKRQLIYLRAMSDVHDKQTMSMPDTTCYNGFRGSLNDWYKQIGNAVPSLTVEAA